MTSLWLTFATLIVLAFAFMFWPLMPFSRKKEKAHAIQKQQNINIFHDRLQELEQEKNQGTLEQESFLTLKTELEKTLLHDAQDQDSSALEQVQVSGKHWFIAQTLGIAVVIISLGMYFKIGRSDDLLLSQAMAGQTTEQQAGNNAPPSMEKSIALLESKLAEDPTNTEKILLLANSYAAVGQFDKSAGLYKKMADTAEPNSEEQAGLKGAQAQSLFQASGEKMTSQIQGIIKQALAIDPFEPSSLMLQGIEAFSATNYKQAITFWDKAKQKAGEMQVTRFINPAIQAAQQKLGIAPPQIAKKTESKNQDATASSASVTIDLTLSKDLKSKVNDEHVIFVFARPVGGRMPLAAERIKVKDLPIRIVLDDTKAAMPTAKISSVDTVEITARVSLSGQPMPQKGDLFTTIKDITVKNNTIHAMEISQEVK